MNNKELLHESTIIENYSIGEIIENTEEIKRHISQLLIYSSSSKTTKTKQKYHNLAMKILEILPDEADQENIGIQFSIGRSNDEIYAENPELHGYQFTSELGEYSTGEELDYGDFIDESDYCDLYSGVSDEEYESRVINNSKKDLIIPYDLLTGFCTMYQVDNLVFLREKFKKDALKEDRESKVELLFQLLKKKGVELEKFYDAYESQLWYEDNTMWSNNTMKNELNILRDIHLHTSIDIENFGPEIAIQELYQKANDKNTNSEEIVLNMLKIPCVQKNELDLKKTFQAFKSFFMRTSKEFKPGNDILKFIFDTGEELNLTYACDKYDNNTDLMYRIFYFTQVLNSLQYQGVKIKDFDYSWKELQMNIGCEGVEEKSK